IWGSNPRAWRPPAIRQADVDAFARALPGSGVRAVFLHAPYMVNVASADEGVRARSVELARATVALADALGADGGVGHPGSAGASTATRTPTSAGDGSAERASRRSWPSRRSAGPRWSARRRAG